MRRKTPQADLDKAAALYASGRSIKQVSVETGLGFGTVQRHVIAIGLVRTVESGKALATAEGRHNKKGRPAGWRHTPESIERQREAALRRNAATARRWCEKARGYAYVTTGPDRGRLVHRVVMERVLGRKLDSAEHVHHIDGNGLNNDPSNLMLVSNSEHTRIHNEQRRAAMESK